MSNFSILKIVCIGTVLFVQITHERAYAGLNVTESKEFMVFKVDISSPHQWVCANEVIGISTDIKPIMGAEIEWSINNDQTGGAIVDQSGIVVAGPHAGTFEVVATERTTGCSDAHSVTILDEVQATPYQIKIPINIKFLNDLSIYDISTAELDAMTQLFVFKSKKILDAQQEAIRTTEFEYRDVGGHDDGAASNAFLHAYWNYLMTKAVGIEAAKRYANAHENFMGNPCDDGDGHSKSMDLSNNDIGRNMAIDPQYANYTEQQIINELMNMAQNGGLVVKK